MRHKYYNYSMAKETMSSSRRLPSLPESSVLKFDEFVHRMESNTNTEHHNTNSQAHLQQIYQGGRISNKPRRRPSFAKIMLHQLFRGRARQLRLPIILPILFIFLSFTLCLPVLLVSDLSSQNIDKQFRKFKRAVDGIYIALPSAFSQPTSFINRNLSNNNNNNEDAQFQIPHDLDLGDGDGGMLPENLQQVVVLSPTMAGELEPPQPLTPYSLPNVVKTVPYFHDTFAVLVYDPPTDKFIGHYSSNMRWISSCQKLINSLKITAHSLRMLYPDRFRAGSGVPEFALAISSADYPGMRWTACIREQRSNCIREEIAPILQFGSVFREPIVPTMMAMPMPQQNQLNCFHYWAMHREVCEFYLPRGPANPNGLVFGETLGLGYDDLIPQVIWRGTDFSYLHKLEPWLRPPNFELDVASQIDMSGRVDKKTSSTNAMRQIYEELIPRWKGVVWTAEAEREAERANNQLNRKNRTKRRAVARKTQEVIPWCNIKFAGAMYMGKKTAVSEIETYQQFEEYGIPAIGEGMSLEDLGRFKYHIDLGGGGGTTWSGTLEKLGLPGVLFHHVTPTKDYLHDRMQPWVHYVPVKADLSDLKEKYEWAESHPLMAKRISDNATQLARSFGTPEGMEALFRQFYEWPLGQLIEAYQPIVNDNSGAPGDWKDALVQMGAGPEELRPIIQCGGYFHHDCERLADDIKFTKVHDRDVNMSARKRKKQ